MHVHGKRIRTYLKCSQKSNSQINRQIKQKQNKKPRWHGAFCKGNDADIVFHPRYHGFYHHASTSLSKTAKTIDVYKLPCTDQCLNNHNQVMPFRRLAGSSVIQCTDKISQISSIAWVQVFDPSEEESTGGYGSTVWLCFIREIKVQCVLFMYWQNTKKTSMAFRSRHAPHTVIRIYVRQFNKCG